MEDRGQNNCQQYKNEETDYKVLLDPQIRARHLHDPSRGIHIVN